MKIFTISTIFAGFFLIATACDFSFSCNILSRDSRESNGGGDITQNTPEIGLGGVGLEVGDESLSGDDEGIKTHKKMSITPLQNSFRFDISYCVLINEKNLDFYDVESCGCWCFDSTTTLKKESSIELCYDS